MTTYHPFDENATAAAIETARKHYHSDALKAQATNPSFGSNGHMLLAAQCISVTVENGKVCLSLPVVGKECLPIPSTIPNGTAAEACLSICTAYGIPTGVEVTIAIAGRTIVRQAFGHC